MGWQGEGEGQLVWHRPEGPFQSLQRGQTATERGGSLRQDKREELELRGGIVRCSWQGGSKVTRQSRVCGAKA